MNSATASPADLREAKMAATRRVQARQAPPEYKTAVSPDGHEVRVQTGGGVGQYLRPTSVSEWLDDRLARTSIVPGPATEALFAVAEAAREGPAAADKAVSHASALGEHDQWRLFQAMMGWQGADGMYPPAEALISALLRAWRQAGLADSRPAAPEPYRVITVNQASLDESEARRRESWKRR